MQKVNEIYLKSSQQLEKTDKQRSKNNKNCWKTCKNWTRTNKYLMEATRVPFTSYNYGSHLYYSMTLLSMTVTVDSQIWAQNDVLKLQNTHKCEPWRNYCRLWWGGGGGGGEKFAEIFFFNWKFTAQTNLRRNFCKIMTVRSLKKQYFDIFVSSEYRIYYFVTCND